MDMHPARLFARLADRGAVFGQFQSALLVPHRFAVRRTDRLSAHERLPARGLHPEGATESSVGQVPRVRCQDLRF